MMADVSGKDRDTNKNLLENNNSNCLEKGNCFKEIKTVMNELNDRKKEGRYINLLMLRTINLVI